MIACCWGQTEMSDGCGRLALRACEENSPRPDGDHEQATGRRRSWPTTPARAATAGLQQVRLHHQLHACTRDPQRRKLPAGPVRHLPVPDLVRGAEALKARGILRAGSACSGNKDESVTRLERSTMEE